MFLKRFWPALSWAAVIMLLIGLPGDVFPDIVSFWDWLGPDKIVHLIIFGTLSFLIMLGFRETISKKGKIKYALVSLLIAVFYGILTEILQYYVFIGRSGNVFDALADAFGAILGVVLYETGIKLLKKVKLFRV